MRQTFNKATALHQLGKFEEAAHLYRQVLKSLPNQPEVLHALGVLYLQTNDYQRASQLLEKAAKTHSTSPNILLSLAEAYRNLGNATRAINCAKSAINLNVKNPDAHYCLASAFHDAKQVDLAIISYRNVLQLNPNSPEAHNSLGAALEEQGLRAEALAHFKKSVQLAPNYVAPRINLGKALRNADQPYEALQCYQKVVELGAGSAQTQLTIGDIWLELQDHDKALPHYKEAVRINSGSAEAYNGIGACEMAAGNRESAAQYFEKALEINPKFVTPIFNLAQINKVKSKDSLIISRINKRLQAGSLDEAEKAGLHFALGKLLDDCGDYDNAFANIREANRMVYANSPYDIQRDCEKLKAIQSCYTKSLFDRFNDAGSDSKAPVFVIGMPRSGTTLTEQIISSHPDVSGAGELRLAFVVESHLSDNFGTYPECLNSISTEVITNEAKWYLEGLNYFSPKKPSARIVDKMPHNFFRLGLIALMFPKAKIIHCRRSPMDNCLSLYFQSFAPRRHPYSYDLVALGEYYKLYMKLIEHWRNVLPLEMLEVDYEETIANPEESARRLIDFIGLEWDDACSEPHKLDRTVKTASHWQVRQPIYKTSVERWKNYESYLGPLKEALGYQEEL